MLSSERLIVLIKAGIGNALRAVKRQKQNNQNVGQQLINLCVCRCMQLRARAPPSTEHRAPVLTGCGVKSMDKIAVVTRVRVGWEWGSQHTRKTQKQNRDSTAVCIMREHMRLNRCAAEAQMCARHKQMQLAVRNCALK